MNKIVAASTLILISIATYCRQPDLPSGVELAQVHCTSCHALPQPEELNKDTWRDIVLPRMGQFVGIYDDSGQRSALIANSTNPEKVRAANIYPEEPTLPPPFS